MVTLSALEAGSVPTSAPCHDQARDALEPIAVVGFSLKYPQDADSAPSFWSMLKEKRCAMTEWPRDRINLEAFYHRDENRDEKVCNSRLWRLSSTNSEIAKWIIKGLCAWCTLSKGGSGRI